LLRSAWT